MTFQALPVENDDWPKLMDIAHRAWGDDPVWNCLYPRLDTPAGKSQAIARIFSPSDVNSAPPYIKIVENGSGAIVGGAWWHFFPEDPFSSTTAGKGTTQFRTGEWLGSGDDPTREFFEFFYNKKRLLRCNFDELRRSHACMSLLYQRA